MTKYSGSVLKIYCSMVILIGCSGAGNAPLTVTTTDNWVDIGTHKLHFVVSEVNSQYTIILESGGGADSRDWRAIQDTLALLTGTNVISYDRSGFGDSDLGPVDLDPAGEMDALARSLVMLGIKDNLILVGHSYGGLLAHLFATRYTEMVKGMLLLDPMNVRFVDRFGLERLQATVPQIEDPQSKFEKALVRMVNNFPKLIENMRGSDLPQNIPVLLISVGSPPYDDRPEDIVSWRISHEEMMKSSELHEFIYAEHNTHQIIRENPELIFKSTVKILKILDRE